MENCAPNPYRTVKDPFPLRPDAETAGAKLATAEEKMLLTVNSFFSFDNKASDTIWALNRALELFISHDYAQKVRECGDEYLQMWNSAIKSMLDTVSFVALLRDTQELIMYWSRLIDQQQEEKLKEVCSKR